MCEALYQYLMDEGILIDEDYIDDETFYIMAMDADICECSSVGQSTVLITLGSSVRITPFALKDRYSNIENYTGLDF